METNDDKKQVLNQNRKQPCNTINLKVLQGYSFIQIVSGNNSLARSG